MSGALPGGDGPDRRAAAARTSWAYDPGGSRRDLRLDLLRGVCLLKMVFDHLWLTPVHALEDWLGFVSAAEGFFFISGAVVGIVHGRRAREEGLGVAGRRVLVRAAHLYLANLTLTFFFLALEAGGWLDGNEFSRFWSHGTLAWPRLFALNLPYYLHVLPRYVVFLALTPLALWCLLRRRTPWLLAASGALYALARTLGGAPRLPWLESGGYLAFPVLPWQLLFFVGMACGYHRRRLAAAWQRLGGRWGRWWTGALLALAAVGFSLLRHAFDGGRLPVGAAAVERWFGRTGLGPGRLVDLAVVFTLSFLLVHRLWRPLARWLGPLLVPIGQRSLYVFLVHIVIVSLGAAWLPAVAGGLLALPWALLVLDLALMALLWGMVRGRFLFGFIPN